MVSNVVVVIAIYNLDLFHVALLLTLFTTLTLFLPFTLFTLRKLCLNIFGAKRLICLYVHISLWASEQNGVDGLEGWIVSLGCPLHYDDYLTSCSANKNILNILKMGLDGKD